VDTSQLKANPGPSYGLNSLLVGGNGVPGQQTATAADGV